MTKKLSDGERRQNEMGDVRNYLVGKGGLSPEELDLITNDMSNGRLEALTPEQRMARYQTYANSKNDEWKNLAWQALRGDERVNQQGYETFASMFGRAPTATEWAQLVPIFGGAEGQQRGNAAVASMFEAYKRSPEYLKTQAGQYAGQLDPMFDQYLSRDASASEQDYFGQMLAAGRSPYEIEQMLKGTQEYQTNQDAKFRTGLASELEGYDQSFFDKAKENVYSRAQRQGGGVSQSSSLDFALTKLMGDIAEKRSQYLSGLSAQQYGGNKDAARADYLGTMDRYYGDQDYQRRMNDADREYYRSRSDEDRDYQRQSADYERYLSGQRQGGKAPWGTIVGGVVGGGLGAYFGGPMGAQAGYNIGSGVGGGYDYMNRY